MRNMRKQFGDPIDMANFKCVRKAPALAAAALGKEASCKASSQVSQTPS
jgi:hypothetical protein